MNKLALSLIRPPAVARLTDRPFIITCFCLGLGIYLRERGYITGTEQLDFSWKVSAPWITGTLIKDTVLGYTGIKTEQPPAPSNIVAGTANIISGDKNQSDDSEEGEMPPDNDVQYGNPAPRQQKPSRLAKVVRNSP